MSRFPHHRHLVVALCLATAPALAQQEAGIDDEDTRGGLELEEDIPDVVIPDVEISDVEIPDVQVGAQDRVVEEEPEPPPTAVFEDPAATADESEPPPPPPATAARDVEQAPPGTGVTGDIRAIDLNAGTLEVDTDTQGTLVLSADRARLRQLAPGQSVSLSYVDRPDGRWVSELETLRPAAPPVSAPAP